MAHEASDEPADVGRAPTARRAVLAAGAAIAVGLAADPSGAQPAAPSGPTPGLEFVYEAIVTIAPGTPVGTTPFGRRNRIPITGGAFAGPRIRGSVLAGGMDWQLIRPDGFTVIEADYMMQADDGTLIHVVNKGLIGTREGRPYWRTTPWFEAPGGPHAWLNEAVFAGTLEPLPGRSDAVRVGVFRVI